MFEFYIPAIMLGAGILCLIYPHQIGVGFCRLGKAIWRVTTLGLTDMHWFYPEEKAHKTFRLTGIFLILFSIPWGIMVAASFSGPGAFAAVRESRTYLAGHYGSADSWGLSPKSNLYGGDGDYLVTYRYGTRSGILHAEWKSDHYAFSEAVEKQKSPAGPTRSSAPQK